MVASAGNVANKLIGCLERAWNDADGRAFGEPFSANADFVDIRGEHHCLVHVGVVHRADLVAVGVEGNLASLLARSERLTWDRRHRAKSNFRESCYRKVANRFENSFVE